MSRLSIEVSPQQLQQIKAMAALQGKSIKDFILEKVIPKDNDEEKAWKESEAFVLAQKENARTQPLVKKTLREIAKEKIEKFNQIDV